MTDVTLKINQLIIDKLGVEEKLVNNEAEFYTDLGVDSLDFYEFIAGIEKTFNVIIEDELYEKLKSVGAVVQHIELKIKKPINGTKP